MSASFDYDGYDSCSGQFHATDATASNGVGRYTDEAALVTLLKNTHLKHGERKLHVLLIAFGSECSRERKFHLWYFRSWERKYVGTKVPAQHRCSSYLLDHPVGDELKIFLTITILSYSTFVIIIMATPTRIRQGTRIVKPILSLDRTEARRRVHNLYKLCYRHIPYISKHMHFWAGVKCGMQKMAVVLITSSDFNGPHRALIMKLDI